MNGEAASEKTELTLFRGPKGAWSEEAEAEEDEDDDVDAGVVMAATAPEGGAVGDEEEESLDNAETAPLSNEGTRRSFNAAAAAVAPPSVT